MYFNLIRQLLVWKNVFEGEAGSHEEGHNLLHTAYGPSRPDPHIFDGYLGRIISIRGYGSF